MGLFSSYFLGAKGIKAVNKIKNGKKSKISYAMVSMLIINLKDAKSKLSSDQYKAIEDLFMEFQKCSTTFEVDMEGYFEMCKEVILKFDAIAPYELYSGGSELEFSFLMDDIRSGEEKKQKFVQDIMHESIIESYSIDENYIKTLLEAIPMSTREDAVGFYKVLIEAKVSGKKAALVRFDKLVDEINERNPEYAVFIVSSLCGFLFPNGIVSKEESTALSNKYMEKLL